MSTAGTLSDSIAETIKLMIIAGEYAVDEKLPNEQVLMEQFNVSRTTLREAIKILASKNIVTIHRGKGTYVNKNPGLVEDPLGLEFVEEGTAIQDICEMRFFIEPIASYLAAQRATKREIELTEDVLRKMKALAKAAQEENSPEEIAEKFRHCESFFHSMVYEMTHNTIFKRLQPVIVRLIFSFYFDHYTYKEHEYELSYEKHSQLFEAIKAKDKNMAYYYARLHLLDMPPFLNEQVVLPEDFDISAL